MNVMKISKILFPTDFTECADAVTDYLAILAKRYKANIEMLYVDEATYLLNPMSQYSDTDLIALGGTVKDYADKKLTEAIEKLDAGFAIRKHFSTGRSYSQIVEAAKKMDVDMIVMGAHGEGGFNNVMGSNAERVVRQSPCPIMTIRKKHNTQSFSRIFVPVDFSDVCRQTMPEILGFARDFGSVLTLGYIAVEHKHESEILIEEKFRKFIARIDISGVIYKTGIFKASSESAGIIEFATKNEIDLIALGTHGRTGLKRVLMGSVTSEVVNNSPIPVLSFHSFKQP